MSTPLLSFEAIGSRFASHSCPVGTTGRIHTLRLRRLFQPSGRRPYSSPTASFEDQVWYSSYDEDHQEGQSKTHWRPAPLGRNQVQQSNVQTSGDISTYSSPDITDTASKFSSTIPVNRKVRKTGLLTENSQRIPRVPTSPQSPTIRRVEASPATIDFFNNLLAQAVRSGSPHKIFDTLLRLINISHGKLGQIEAFRTMRPSTFSEILLSLNPDHFVSRYMDLNRNIIKPRLSSHLTYHYRMKHAIHEFRIRFMAIIGWIMEARRANGYDISLSDYKTLLSYAVTVENPNASKSIWQTLEKEGLPLDTECYNYYLAGILKVGTSDRIQRSELRTKYVPQSSSEEGYEELQLYYERLSAGFKNVTSQVFNDMLQRGIAGDEKTFCLLMIASARVGDLDGVKSILDRVWGINVDKLMTMNENDFADPYPYTSDSPFRPTAKLLFALVHCFGINNMIPIALRLVDYISRKYSLAIPVEVWEDLLGLTYALSVPRKSRSGAGKLRPALMSLDAVSVLWSAMTTEPYNVKPTLAMYDRFIVNLLRRQRFGEATIRIQEAVKVQQKLYSKFEDTLVIDRYLTPMMERRFNHERLVQKQGLIAYEHYLQLKREMAFQRHVKNQSLHFLYRWCRLLLHFAPNSLLENSTFTVVNLPRFIHEYMRYMPKNIQYPIGTGYVSFSCDSKNFSDVPLREKNNPSYQRDFSRELRWYRGNGEHGDDILNGGSGVG